MTTDDQQPYIETPDTLDRPLESGLFCFIDGARKCGADCMSFLISKPAGADYEDQQWSACMLLVNLHKTGKHVVALAGQGDSLLKHLRVKRADEARANQPLPPKVK